MSRGMNVGLSGLIPAHTGSTPTTTANKVGQGAHPRSRGEHPERRACCDLIPGSSPLTRGARAAEVHRDHSAGLIPAHAGSTCR